MYRHQLHCYTETDVCVQCLAYFCLFFFLSQKVSFNDQKKTEIKRAQTATKKKWKEKKSASTRKEMNFNLRKSLPRCTEEIGLYFFLSWYYFLSFFFSLSDSAEISSSQSSMFRHPGSFCQKYDATRSPCNKQKGERKIREILLHTKTLNYIHIRKEKKKYIFFSITVILSESI